MKAARLVVLGVALAAGGVAAYIASGHHEAAPPAAAPPPPIATVEVLIAKNDLARGQVIGDGDVVWQMWPATAANPSFIKRTDRPDAVHEFSGAIVRISVASGEPIREPSVVFGKGSGFLAAVLPKGMRAVAMDVSPESAAGGFILPDDHVDVVLTRHEKTAGAGGLADSVVSETILRNIRILAIDQSVEEKAGQKSEIGKTATLELTPDQAETLTLARQQGTMSLALRSLVDSQAENSDDDELGQETRSHQHSALRREYGVNAALIRTKEFGRWRKRHRSALPASSACSSWLAPFRGKPGWPAARSSESRRCKQSRSPRAMPGRAKSCSALANLSSSICRATSKTC